MCLFWDVLGLCNFSLLVTSNYYSDVSSFAKQMLCEEREQGRCYMRKGPLVRHLLLDVNQKAADPFSKDLSQKSHHQLTFTKSWKFNSSNWRKNGYYSVFVPLYTGGGT